MRFNPNYKLNILSDEEFPTAVTNMEKQLDNCRNSGFFDTFDGKKIYYEYFLCENSRASIVIVHGLSEFTKKFYEVATWFLNQGYNVFLYDQRCHGLSCRLTDRVDLIHVDNFNDYVKDLSVFIDNVVLPAEEKPLYIYSHSMGGAVTAMYLAQHKDKIQKAVLSAPLIEPTVEKVPSWLVRLYVYFGMKKYGSKSKFIFSKEFDPERANKYSMEPSKNRFSHNLNMRCNEPRYQSTPMTYGWVYNSVLLPIRILKRQVAGSIKTPVLLLSAEKDTVVRNDAQVRFAKKCRTCKMVTVNNTDHSMLTASYEVICEHVKQVLDFYAL